MISPQLPLPLPFGPDQCFSLYVGNDFVRQIVAEVASGDRSDWLYLAGAAGSGKTHLLLAACVQASQQGRAYRYLPLDKFVGHLQSVFEGVEIASLICLDNLHSIIGQRNDEEALFHLHNRARSSGTIMIYSSNVLADQLAIQLPDLRSRLTQCTRLSLNLIDDDARRNALKLRAQRRGLLLDDMVIDYLLRNVNRDLTSLTALLDRLDRASLAAQRKITVPFIKNILTEKTH